MSGLFCVLEVYQKSLPIFMLFPTQLLVIALARPRQTYLISECLELLCLRLED